MTAPAWRVSSTGRVSATLRGVVREHGPDGGHLVQLDSGDVIVARPSARMRAKGDLLVGDEVRDEVRVEVQARDMGRGLITSGRRGHA